MKNNEILHIQVRLFRLACRRWKKSIIECSDIFDGFDVDAYIREMYEFFHVQGDEANLDDIEGYLKGKGCEI